MEWTSEITFHDYHLQQSWGKVMYLEASVILLTGGGLPQCMLGYHPLGADPPGADPPGADTPQEQTPSGADPLPPQSMLGDTINTRVVRILLECNLVEDNVRTSTQV